MDKQVVEIPEQTEQGVNGAKSRAFRSSKGEASWRAAGPHLGALGMGSQFETLWKWPKVELHRHLEGTVRLATAWYWARQSPALAVSSMEELRALIQFDGITDFAHFLSKFNTLRELYHDPRAIEQVVREAVADAAAENVRYMELRFSPDHFARQAGYDPYEAAAFILRTGMDEAQRQGIQLRFLCTIGRAYDLPTAEEIFEIALALRDEGIVGIDLAGNELQHPAAPFRSLLERAAAEGFGITIHAGEAGPPGHVWEAINELYAHRIGHGIQSNQDPHLLERLREQNVVLEVCPTSNIHTGVIPNHAHHPLGALVRAGVPVALSSDDPAISDIMLTHEYCFALESGLDAATLGQMILTAASHAFLPNAEKEQLLRDLQAELSAVANLPFEIS